MRIGLNLLYLIPRVVGGTETYARGLVNALAEADPATEFLVYLNRSAADWPLPETSNVRRIVCDVQGPNRGMRFAYEQLRLPARLRRDRVDLVHSLGYTTPTATGCPTVVTVHDLNFRAVPMPWQRRLALETFVRLGVRRADRVIADSAFTRTEIVRVLGGRPERVHVVHAAADPWQPVAQESRRPAGRYLLAFGSGFPHKNIRRLLEAFACARERGLDHRLVIVGRLAAGETIAAAGSYQAHVDVTGYLSAAQLDATFLGATALVFPSRYEGFGLPVLEAMQRHIPVVCSNRAALPEVAGDAALYFDPDDVSAMADALLRITRDPALAAELVRRGQARVRMFDWRRAAEQALDIYREALRERNQDDARTGRNGDGRSRI